MGQTKPIKFPAILYSVRIDREGESKVTLTIPQSDLDAIISLGHETEKLLQVSIKVLDA